MNFAIGRLNFADDTATTDDDKQLKALCDKIRKRFQISVAAGNKDGSIYIGVAIVGESEESLLQTIDKISELCESSGFGRIESEEILVDHMDNIDDQQPAETRHRLYPRVFNASTGICRNHKQTT